jgi:hypothetical protein
VPGVGRSPTTIDLGSLYPDGVRLSPAEHADERAARIAQERADATHARWRETILFGVVLALLVALAGFLLYVLIFADTGRYSDSLKSSAFTSVVGVVTALLGYVIGKRRG